MKKFWKNLTVKQIVLAATAVLSLVAFLVLTAVSGHMCGKQQAQNMAERWSQDDGVSQISCFFSENAKVDENKIRAFEYNLDMALQEASIVSESSNANARLWADAYSTFGKLTLVSDKGQAEVNAIGVGGDFFLFHPLQLINGSFFSSDDLMQDKIIVDEDIAWQLFGSNDIIGQQVLIDGLPYLITGVIKRDSGKLNDYAGNASSIVYVSYDTLYKNFSAKGQSVNINHYEVVMPNPVKDFALGIVTEKIGIGESEIEIVENTTRFGLLPLLEVVSQFGVRSMNGKAIVYPYWENIARGYEDILALILILRIIAIMYPVVLAVIFVVCLWKRRTWHFKDVREWISDKWESYRINRELHKQKEQEELL